MVAKNHIVVLVMTLGSIVMTANVSEYPSYSGPSRLRVVWWMELFYDAVSS